MTDLEDRLKAEAMTREALRKINATPELLSLLYDMDLMPEQHERGSFQWRQMLILTDWYFHFKRMTL